MWLGKSTAQASGGARVVATGGTEGNSSRKSEWFSGVVGLRVGLVLGHAVDDDDAVAQVDVVAGHADQPLHQKQVLGFPSASRSAPA